MNPPDLETLLCIPGPWTDRSDFVQSVVRSTDGRFLFAGMVLMSTEHQDHVTVELYDEDPNMVQSFEVSSRHGLSAETREAIRGHKMTAYLHFPYGASAQRERIARFTSVLREMGGAAVKVESAGTAHDWDAWERYLASDSPIDHYEAFVAIAGDTDSAYSCGMQNLGMTDCEVFGPGDVPGDLQEMSNTVRAFNLYQLLEAPVLRSGQTFAASTEAPTFQMQWTEDARFPDIEQFENPNGVWELRPLPG